MNAFEDIESTLLYQPLTDNFRRSSNGSGSDDGEVIFRTGSYLRRHRSSSSTQRMSNNNNGQHCCFQKRTSLLTIIATIGIVAIITLILNLTLAITSSRNINPTNYAKNSEYINYTFIMNGSSSTTDQNSDTLPIFENIPYSYRLVHLELINIEVNPTLLFRSIYYNYYARDSLEIIRLINITFVGTLNIEQELVLTNLKEFTLEINQQIGPFELLRLKNRNCTVNIFDIESRHIFSHFHDPSCIKSLIFFRKPFMESKWPISKVYQLTTTKIDIIIFGYHIFVWDPENEELVSLLHSTTQILDEFSKSSSKFTALNKNTQFIGTGNNNNNANANFSLKRIHLRDLPLKLATLSNFAQQTTHLTLIDIDFIHDITNDNLTLSTVLSQFKSLEYLDVEHYFPYTIFSTKLNINLNDLSKAINLKSLSLSLARLELNRIMKRNNNNNNNNNGSFLSLLPRFSLNHLELYEFGIENIQIINQFHIIFNGTKSIFWDGELILSSMKFSRLQFWLNVMKIDGLELVMFGNPPTISASLFANEKITHDEKIQIAANNLLKELNISEDDINLDASFVMSKNKTTGKWNGRNFKDYDDLAEAMANNLRLRIGLNMFSSNDSHSTHLKNEYYKLKLHCNV